MKAKSIKILLALLTAIMLTAVFTPAASADNGDIDIIMMVNGFGGGQPMYDLKVTLFNTTKATGYDGKAVFSVKGPSQNVTDLLEVYDNTNSTCHGRATVNFSVAPNINYMIHPDKNPGIFTLDIEYTEETNAIVINAELSQGLDLEILSIDFIQNPNANTQPQQQNPQPPQNQPPEEFHGPDPDMPGNGGIDLGMNPLTLVLIIAVAVLLVVIIVLVVRGAKRKEDSKGDS